MCSHTHTQSYSRRSAPPLPRTTPPHNKQLPASTSAALGAAFVSPRRFIIRGWHSCCAAVVVVSTTGPRRNRQLGADTESSAEFDLVCKCEPGPEWVNAVKPTGLVEEQGREKADMRARGNGRQRDNNNTDSGNVLFKSEKNKTNCSDTCFWLFLFPADHWKSADLQPADVFGCAFEELRVKWHVCKKHIKASQAVHGQNENACIVSSRLNRVSNQNQNVAALFPSRSDAIKQPRVRKLSSDSSASLLILTMCCSSSPPSLLIRLDF